MRAHLVATRRADRTGRTVLRLTSSDHAHTMVILKSSVSDRLGAPRAGALAGWSDRRVHGSSWVSESAGRLVRPTSSWVSESAGCENLLKSSSHWLCPIEDRRRLDSAREGMLEGFSLGSYLLLVDFRLVPRSETIGSFREAFGTDSPEVGPVSRQRRNLTRLSFALRLARTEMVWARRSTSGNRGFILPP